MKRHIIFAALTTLASIAHAEEGVVFIDHAKALAGIPSIGDSPGYPVTISFPGKYKLSGSLKVPDANTHGIDMYANGVDLDLNGHSIVGPNNCGGPIGSPITCTYTGTGRGIRSQGDDVRVHNGTVRGMGANGVELRYSSSVENVNASLNRYWGIYVLKGTVKNCQSSVNGGTGIRVGSGIVKENYSWLNAGDGISVGKGTVASENASNDNQGYGISGSSIVSSSYHNNILNGNVKGAADQVGDTGGNL